MTARAISHAIDDSIDDIGKHAIWLTGDVRSRGARRVAYTRSPDCGYRVRSESLECSIKRQFDVEEACTRSESLVWILREVAGF